MKSRSKTLRLLWGLSVLLGLSIAGYFLMNLFIIYFSHKVTMVVKEERGSEMAFPSLTLCNLNPVANTAVDLKQMKNLFDIFPDIIDSIDVEASYLFGQALDPSTLFVNFAQDGGGRANNFVVSCRWDSDVLESEQSCVQSAEMHLYQSNYGYCFTFDPPENRKHIYGFSAILYIDDSFEVVMPSCELNLARPFASGAVLTAHLRNSLPDIKHGVILQSGKSTEVHISHSRRVHLPPPYPPNCDPNPSMPEDNHVYTGDTCLDLCYQNEVINLCGCVNDLALSVPSQFKSDIDYCSKLDDGLDMFETSMTFVNRLKCVRSVLSNTSHCDVTCPVMCQEERYDLTSAMIDWPHPIIQLAFYIRYIHKKPYQDRFQVYRDLSASRANGTSTSGLYDILRQTTKMTDNFLQVSELRPLLRTWFYLLIALE